MVTSAAAVTAKWSPSRWPTGIRRAVGYAVQPLAVGMVGFGFAYATGGIEAVRFWLLAIPVTLWEIIWKAILLLAAFIGTGGLIQVIWVPYLIADRVSTWAWQGRHDMDGLIFKLGVSVWVLLRFLESLIAAAAEHSVLAPANIPYTESGWGTVGAGAVGLVPLILAGMGGGRARLALLPPRRLTTPTPRSAFDDDPVPEEFWSSEVVVAWRAWKWNGCVLRGVWCDWPTTRFEATCDTCREAPGWNHRCGIYAVKDRSALSAHVVGHDGGYVFGKVELSGSVIEHDAGYRSASAEIIELFAPREIAEAIRQRYPSVPVRIDVARA